MLWVVLVINDGGFVVFPTHMWETIVMDLLPLSQSDREKSEGLPVAPFMDRDKVTKPTAQIGFLKFVLIPMFETITKVNYEKAVFGDLIELIDSKLLGCLKNVPV